MASRSEEALRPAWGLVLLAAITVGLAVTASVIGRSTLGPSGSVGVSPAPIETGKPQARAEQALPVPDGNTIVAVLDPVVEAPSISADEAIGLARADGSNLVGKSPRVQLVTMTARSPGSPLDGFTGWIVFSTDVPGYLWGPYIPNASSPTIFATYSWVFVTLNGDVVAATQVIYETAESVPPLP